jgi:adenylate kinase
MGVRRNVCVKIIVLGISGVGKTTACRSFVTRHRQFMLISASELLREATGLSEEELRTADAKEVLHNQAVLSAMLTQRLSRCPDASVIIDGQVIIDNGREIVRVPVDVVRSVNPIGMILLEAPAEEVVRRRLSSGVRRPKRVAPELAFQMNLARDLVVDYGRVLNIPVEIASVGRDFMLDGLVDALSPK